MIVFWLKIKRIFRFCSNISLYASSYKFRLELLQFVKDTLGILLMRVHWNSVQLFVTSWKVQIWYCSTASLVILVYILTSVLGFLINFLWLQRRMGYLIHLNGFWWVMGQNRVFFRQFLLYVHQEMRYTVYLLTS